ncbi:hypothetical protein PSTG_06898 [Puccinia striiformis f. sp. tritici PST-78]|uniref:CxC1-like cysteine cluster associated with KDZ transposases domain-containing protein n=1 Tax=Puccinia striiformis f. sp. tritici PST-78 TaxID=1165861 RepID=A0A0L0VLB6_9BASI|nr:hypothetical protein PSTG_06898 [Puccinia striiformis f. sp. tritici PST-78]
MRGYQGEGGKKQRRTKKPRTQQGIALIAEVERGSQDFASTLQPQTAPPPEQNTLTTNDLQQEHEYHPIENNNHETEALPIDHRVRELQAYLESEDYRLKKILEEKHWEEVYEQMFSKFYECAAQMSNWGDITKWNHDWKPECGSEPSYQTCEWRRTMSSAVDAFREMLRREQLITEIMMSMNLLDKLAAICPKCFGPYVAGKQEDKAHYHVCMDANFQQR